MMADCHLKDYRSLKRKHHIIHVGAGVWSCACSCLLLRILRCRTNQVWKGLLKGNSDQMQSQATECCS